jgi:hypothetical protein
LVEVVKHLFVWFADPQAPPEVGKSFDGIAVEFTEIADEKRGAMRRFSAGHQSWGDTELVARYLFAPLRVQSVSTNGNGFGGMPG